MEKNKKIAVISLSGGLDSTALLIRLFSEGYEIHGISFDYGQKHSVELLRLIDNLSYLGSKGFQLESYQTIDLSHFGKSLDSSLTSTEPVPVGHYESKNMLSTVVPNRNFIFLTFLQSLALSLSKQHGKEKFIDICLGVHSGDHAIYPDCRLSFYNAAMTAFKEGNWETENISMYIPYIDMNKTFVLADLFLNCLKMKISPDTIIANTNTSYNPDDKGRSSGTSGSDIERIEAFINLGLNDQVDYIKPWDEVVEETKILLAKNVLNKNKKQE